MRSSKSRSRSKPNRSRPSGGNVVNRVFDSSGPEGKVRGTPQQIIDKYQMLARDAQLSNDRVAAENFLQHAEHYTRMLGEAQREMEDRRLQQERENQARQMRENQEREAREARRAEQDQGREARRAEQDQGREVRRGEPDEPRDARRAEPERFEQADAELERVERDQRAERGPRAERSRRRVEPDDGPRGDDRPDRRAELREGVQADARDGEPRTPEDAGPIETPEERKRTRRSRSRRPAAEQDDGSARSSSEAAE